MTYWMSYYMFAESVGLVLLQNNEAGTDRFFKNTVGHNSLIQNRRTNIERFKQIFEVQERTDVYLFIINFE